MTHDKTVTETPNFMEKSAETERFDDRGTDLNVMLQTVKLPACVSDLDAGLTDVDGNALPHVCLAFARRPENPITTERGKEAIK